MLSAVIGVMPELISLQKHEVEWLLEYLERVPELVTRDVIHRDKTHSHALYIESGCIGEFVEYQGRQRLLAIHLSGHVIQLKAEVHVQAHKSIFRCLTPCKVWRMALPAIRELDAHQQDVAERFLQGLLWNELLFLRTCSYEAQFEDRDAWKAWIKRNAGALPGLTQDEIGDYLNRSAATLSRWTNADDHG